MTAPASTHRLDYLDAVRAFALILGIVFHASMSFMPIYIGWAVMDVSTSSHVGNFMFVSHSFRMELFFLIAGFFSHMTLHRKGAGAFVNSRLIRIAIPLVVGWFILRPLLVSGWVMGGESLQGDVHILNGLKLAFQSVAQAPREVFTGTHLWFLYYLLLVTAIMLSVRALLNLNTGLHAKAGQWADRMVAWIVDSRLSLLILSVPTGLCLWGMNNWGMDTPDKSLFPHWPVLGVYSGCFGFGWLLHRQAGLIERFGRLTWGRVALGVVGTVAALQLSRYQGNLGHPHIGLIHAGFAFSYAVMMWSLVALSLGLFKRWFDRPSKVVRYVADSSYWLYLVHLPIVIWLQIAFAELPLPWSLKLAVVSVLTVGIAIVLYDLFVRSTLIGKVLSGRTKDRALFRWGARETGALQPEMASAGRKGC